MDKKQTDKKKPGAMGLDNHLPIEGQGRDEMIKIHAWSFEDAWDAQEEWENRYGPNIRGQGPFFRWVGAGELKGLYKVYLTGNQAAITEALYICSLNSLPIPRWCEMAYLSAYREVRHYKAKSWDDVFGNPHPKGAHLGTLKEERKKSLGVYLRIKEIKQKNPDTPIDGYLFETIGKEFGTGGKTKTEGWYYKWKNKLQN